MSSILRGIFSGREILAAPAAPAEPAEELAIPWWTVDGGGGTSLGGPYALYGTVGQPDAGNIAGGVYSIKGGFWGGSIDYVTNLPLIIR